MKLNRTSEKVVRALLGAPGGSLDIWQLCRGCGYLLEVIESVEALRRGKMVRVKDSKVYLTGRSRLPRYLLKKGNSLREVMRRYVGYQSQVVFNEDCFDQLQILPPGIENKLSLMLKRNDLLNRDILCLGDDDLFSVACSLTGLPRSVTVFDIDERVIAFINKIAPRLPVPIRTVKLNLVERLPKRYEGSFDVFITEPPDTVKGTLLFVSRGISSLRRDGVFYLGVTEMTLNKRHWLKIEQPILGAGVVFTDILRDYEEYVTEGDDELRWKGFEKLPKWITKPAKRPWFVSTLFRGEVPGQKGKIKISIKNVEKELITSLLP